MRKHHLARGLVCLLLAAGLICSAAPVASAAQADAPSLQTDAAQAAALVDLEQAKADLTQAREAAGLIEGAVDELDPDETVRVIVQTSIAPAVGKEDSMAYTASAKQAEADALNQQETVIRQAEAITGNAVINQSAYLVNTFTMDMTVAEMEKVAELNSVTAVYPATRFELKMSYASQMTTVRKMWQELGYSGEGTVIAIIDTGVPVNHPDMKLSDGTAVKITRDDALAMIEKLGYGKYYSDKIPFAYSYTGFYEMDNSYKTHGMHVSGIAAGNGGEDGITGIAPEAQILGLQVFGMDGGAYTEYGVNITKAGGWASAGPYDIDNVWTDSYCVYTNHPVGGPYRGFGMCEIHFAIEQNIDMIAKKMGISEVEIRRINGLRPGGFTGMGEKMDVAGYQECLETVLEDIEYDKPCEPSGSPTRIRAKGIAAGWKSPSMPTNAGSAAIIRMNEDGTFFLMSSGMEIGQGAATVLPQIAAEVLSVSPDKITFCSGDTDHTPYEWQTVASRTTYCAGNAVKLAAEDLVDKVLELAQIKMGAVKRDLKFEDGYVVHKIYPERRVPISEFALGVAFPDGSGYGGPAIGVGTFTLENNINTDKKTGVAKHHPAAFWTMGVNGVEVEVDTETGHIKVLKMCSCFDAGKVINPALFGAQSEGAMVQALGTALFEELKLKNGKVLNKNFVDYKIPTADDIPELIVKYVEHAEPTGPFGARGVGEPLMVPGAPAIANAVYNAIGVRFTRMPIMPEDVLRALKEKKEAEQNNK